MTRSSEPQTPSPTLWHLGPNMEPGSKHSAPLLPTYPHVSKRSSPGLKATHISQATNVLIYSRNGSPTVLSPPQSSRPPPPIGIVSNGVLPVCHRLAKSISRSLIPRYCHHNIHVTSTFYYYNHSSWFSGLPIKWSSGNMNVSTYAYHVDLTPRVCQKCSHPHRLDVISFVSQCPCADHIISSFIYAWPAPFNRIASVWWSSCTHLADKINFTKMLVPSSLYEAMTTPAHGESKPQRVLAFKNALPQRQQKRKDALSDALTWLAEDRPPRPHSAPQGPNTWGKPNSTYSTSHTPPEFSAARYHPPPEGLPDVVKAPLPRKTRAHECKNPMRPRPPPKKQKADPNDKPAQRTRTDTFAPRAVAPGPPPPDTDNNNRRITDFFTAAPGPRDLTMVTLSSESTYAAQSSASDPHTSCSRHHAPTSSSTSE